MTTTIGPCPIWGAPHEANVTNTRFIKFVESSRAGGAYIITREAELAVRKFDDSRKSMLTSWLIDQRLRGTEVPEITIEDVKHIERKRPLTVRERADRLLRFIAEKSDTIGTRIRIRKDAAVFAWSEAISGDEIEFLLEYLEEKNWIKGNHLGDSFSIMLEATVTVEGYGRIADQATNVDSSQAFVAMWFDESMNEACQDGIELGIRDAGYEPFRVDRKEHTNKIDDEIIAEIRRSRFIVADFTQGADGARGGVYFEAGFAHGLGIPVIYTCHRDLVKELHFDTRQYAHILWDSPEDLREKLKNRILAVIGQGPVAPKTVSGEVGGNTNGEMPA